MEIMYASADRPRREIEDRRERAAATAEAIQIADMIRLSRRADPVGCSRDCGKIDALLNGTANRAKSEAAELRCDHCDKDIFSECECC